MCKKKHDDREIKNIRYAHHRDPNKQVFFKEVIIKRNETLSGEKGPKFCFCSIARVFLGGF